MKRMIKMLIRPFWRMSAPFRRPLIRKFDRHMMHLLGNLPRPYELPADFDLLLNSVVRELSRLQAQVEALQHQIEDMHAADPDGTHLESRLSVIGEIG